jgi:hypothetical protein
MQRVEVGSAVRGVMCGEGERVKRWEEVRSAHVEYW